jgi:putative membrane protein
MVLGTMLAAVSHWRWWRAERAMRLKQTLSGSLLVPLMAYGLTVVALGALVLVLWFGSGAR